MKMRNYHSHILKIHEKEQGWRKLKTLNMPLDIEIGCGVGMHPLLYASAHPERFLIAIEKTREKFGKFSKKNNTIGPYQNLLPIHGNSTYWLPQHIGSQEVDQYFILYPCPYPRAAQANKRWFNMPFMAYLIDTLKPGGTITLATNEQFYFDEAHQQAQDIWGLTIQESRLLPQNFPARTHFEKKYLERQEHCYQLVAQKQKPAP
ncbi:SAM-dependent methyltransferase [Piscirickettsia salmonis]|uniref:SAM-dependent methyltransferase n=1 Tax=Piscirickettsia salmonis TaxID=1238 RepID=UPI0012BA6865|nr:SAM-dependent methyltransferase [Piscirickettsia salmonis]